MKLKSLLSLLFSLIVCFFIAFGISSAKDEESTDKTPFISGHLYSQAGCGTEPVADAEYYIFSRTENTMICERGRTGPDGSFICKSFYNDPRTVYIHFTKNGKVGCYLFEQNQPNISGLKICMTNFSFCPNEW